GKTAQEVDAALAAALAAVPGGHANQVLRQVVRNIPRHAGRELNHAAIRGFKAEALHYQLDLRRPESHREVGVGAPGRRQTLPEIVAEYLGRRVLPPEIDQAAFLRTGTEVMAQVEREWAEG